MQINTLVRTLLFSPAPRTFAQRPQMLLMKIAQRGIKSSPVFNEENENKINKFNGNLAAYFDDFMRRRPANPSGYINLSKENFMLMIKRAQNEKDLQTLAYAHVQYIGHRSVLPQSYIEAMLSKALELGHPETMIEVFQYHSELLFHPHSDTVKAYFEFFKNKGYDSLKTFFEKCIKGNHLMLVPNGVHE